MTRRELWEMTGRGEGRGGGVGKDVNSIINTFLGLLQLVKGFCTENFVRKINGQVLNKPQMSGLLLKNP